MKKTPVIIIGIVIVTIVILQYQVNMPPANGEQTLEYEISNTINEYRIENGLNELSYDDVIGTIALQHAKDLAEHDLLQHETPGTNIGPAIRGAWHNYDYCGDSQAVRHFKQVNLLMHQYFITKTYHDAINLQNQIDIANQNMLDEKIQRGLSENISQVFTTDITDDRITPSAMNGWKNSPAHDQAMKNTNESIGIGIVQDDDRVIIVTNFC